MWWGYYRKPAARKPRKTKGGIKAHSRRGAFGQNWWSKQLAEVMADYDGDLSGGKTYARQGQVLSINIERCMISGVVQGSKRDPYTVKIKIPEIKKQYWHELAKEISRWPAAAADLMAGRIPDDVNDMADKIGISLIPNRWDLRSKCGCYRGGNCKHTYAVWLLVAEQTDRDPFLIFRMRGIERESLLEMAGLAAADDDGQKPGLIQMPKTEPLSTKHHEFWGQERQVQSSWQIRPPALHAALPKQLGNFPYWRSSEGFIPVMEEIYKGASLMGLGTFLGKE